MAAEVVKSDLEIECVFLLETYTEVEEFDKEKLVYVSEDVLRHLSDEKTPQGIVVRVKIPNRTLCAPSGNCLILDGVADPGNVGAIIRTANAAGYSEIYLTETCADPYAPKCVRASMSGLFFTKLYFGTRAEILQKMDGLDVVVADMGGTNVFSFTPQSAFALVIGNEANGISNEMFSAATHTVKIPMSETQESLNAAVSAGIIMYQLNKEKFKE